MGNTERQKQTLREWYIANKHWYAEKMRNQFAAKADKIKAIKEENPCLDCGVRYPFYVMQFDHVRGVKSFNMNKAARYSWDKIQEEMDKCEIVCANCHSARTHNRRATNSTVE